MIIKVQFEFYGGNYAQIYNWVKKYESNGEDALEDRRGKRKSEEQTNRPGKSSTQNSRA